MGKVYTNNPTVTPWQLPELGGGGGDHTKKIVRTDEEERAYLAGYEEALLKIRDEAYVVAKEEADQFYFKANAEKMQEISAVLRSLQKPLMILDHKVEHEIISLIRLLVQRICRSQLQLKPKLLQAVVKEALQFLPITDQQVIITAHPQDITILRNVHGKLGDCHYEFKEDNAIPRGDLRVQTNNTEIDASVNTRLHNLLEQITDYENPRQINSQAAEISD